MNEEKIVAELGEITEYEAGQAVEREADVLG